MLNNVVAHDIAQGVGIPAAASQQSLLPPGARITRSLGAHPSGLARLVAEQNIEKIASRRRNTILREQWPDAPLHIAQRRCPKLQCIFNRRAATHHVLNHGCPLIQNFDKNATVVLALLWQLFLCGFCEGHLTVRTSSWWGACEKVEDRLPDCRHARLRRRFRDSFFSVPLL